MLLVVGLGNPGTEYSDNRHNIGFMVLDQLASRWQIGPLKAKFGGEHGRGEAAGQPVVLLKPLQYMNLSGQPVRDTAAFYRIEPRNLIVVHDDIDLDFGRIKVKVGGGHGGHNGLRSIAEHIGPTHVRVRCGVGHPGRTGPPPKDGVGRNDRVVGHVLGPFSKAEQRELPDFLQYASDAVETIVKRGVPAAMNEFNSERVRPQ